MYLSRLNIEMLLEHRVYWKSGTVDVKFDPKLQTISKTCMHTENMHAQIFPRIPIGI